MVLEVTLYFAGRGVEGDCRGCEKIVAGALVAHPRPAIAGAPDGGLSLRIVGAGNPHRPAVGLPLVAFGPSLAPGRTRRRHRVGLPHGLPGLGIERRDKSAYAEFAARDANYYLAVGDERRQRHVIPGCVVLNLGGPRLLAGFGIERHE